MLGLLWHIDFMASEMCVKVVLIVVRKMWFNLVFVIGGQLFCLCLGGGEFLCYC